MLFAFTNYQAKALLDFELGKAEYEPPAELYLALLSADPTKAGSLTSELSGGGYARQPILASMSAVTLATGISTNTTTIQTASASIDLGIVTHLGLIDAITAGTMRYYAQLETAFVFNQGEAFQLIPGQMQIRFL